MRTLLSVGAIAVASRLALRVMTSARSGIYEVRHSTLRYDEHPITFVFAMFLWLGIAGLWMMLGLAAALGAFD